MAKTTNAKIIANGNLIVLVVRCVSVEPYRLDLANKKPHVVYSVYAFLAQNLMLKSVEFLHGRVKIQIFKFDIFKQKLNFPKNIQCAMLQIPKLALQIVAIELQNIETDLKYDIVAQSKCIVLNSVVKCQKATENHQVFINRKFFPYNINRYDLTLIDALNNNSINNIRHICITRTMRMSEYVLSVLSNNVDSDVDDIVVVDAAAVQLTAANNKTQPAIRVSLISVPKQYITIFKV
ncbi:hypothetical protein AGLY_005133 [Aphis glycines]|uniref:Uncharacterized protein n=1 Tax=Aphis glycines TaxID=307491 RepID=A0A6G0TW09_APHGL|nr:hypothetical protein AGLY_005133 [Aphis glycines]